MLEYIEEIKKDILKNLSSFLPVKTINKTAPIMFPWMKELPFKKYKVNVIVDNSNLNGAPVIIEKNPSHKNLFGIIEKEAQLVSIKQSRT